jgi:hypothetical protein
VQHAVDLHRGHGSAAQRGQKNRRSALPSEAKAPFQRLGDERRQGLLLRLELDLVRQSVLASFLDHSFFLPVPRHYPIVAAIWNRRGAIALMQWVNLFLRRGASC